jgi:hypothetical protein
MAASQLLRDGCRKRLGAPAWRRIALADARAFIGAIYG